MPFSKKRMIQVTETPHPESLQSKKNTEPPSRKKGLGTDIEFSLTSPEYKLDELILPKNTIEELLTVINAERNWSKVFIDWEMQDVIKKKNSILVNLYGESGTGKTMAAHVIAREIGKKLVCVNYADIESKYVGETSKNLTAIFSYAAENDAVLFFDEADALLSRRVTNMSNSTDVSVNQTRSVLLTLMNDYRGMVIFTTNFISNFDPAFMRRIPYHIKFSLPNRELREKLWKRYVPQKMPAAIDYAAISEKYAEISGSDISNAVLRAALKAAQLGDDTVKHDYFCEAVESIIKSKRDNAMTGITITQRPVMEEYALSQINKKEEK